MSKPQPVIRAHDLGWGFSKFSFADADGVINYKAIPSLAPKHSGMDLSLSFMGKRDTVVVNIDGSLYEIGADSADLDSNDTSRSLNDQYIFTEQYKAVFYGTLVYINEPVIDLLVVGLPLSNMHLADKLKEIVIGNHKANDTFSCEVKDVLILPQPLGGLYYCMSKSKDVPEFEFLDEDVNLIIDPGFFTFDFLLTNGKKMIENKSNSHPGGVSKILRSIATSISKKFGIKYENLNAIDKGLRRKRIKINGEVEDLIEHIKNTKSVIEGSVNYMKNIVGDGSDIDNIILVGGGGALYQKTIEQFYPNHKIIVVEDGQFANVKGYQLAGEASIKK